MHLLHIKQTDPDKFFGHRSQLELKALVDSAIPDYSILPHTWGNDEVTFQDF